MSVDLLNDPDPMRRLESLQNCTAALVESTYFACQGVHDDMDEVNDVLAHADRAMWLISLARDCIDRSKAAIDEHCANLTAKSSKR